MEVIRKKLNEITSLALSLILALVVLTVHLPDAFADEGNYSSNEIVGAGNRFFGRTTAGLA